MKRLIVCFESILLASTVYAAPAPAPNVETSLNPRSKGFVTPPGFNKEACCKCWSDLYINHADWQVARPPRPCNGDCTCDWCGTNNADATYGTPCAGAGEPGAWGYCVANCAASSIVSTPAAVKTRPPMTLPTPPTSIIKTFPPTTFSTHTSKQSTYLANPPPPEIKKRQDQTITVTVTASDLPITTESLPYVVTVTTTASETVPTDTSIFFEPPADTISLVLPTDTTSDWNGGTTIENTGTLTFEAGTSTFTYGDETVTVTFAPTPVLGPISRPDEQWTTVSELPSETTWYGGDGPAFTLTFPADERTTDGPELLVPIKQKRQFDSFSLPGDEWTRDSELPSETIWEGGDSPAFTLTLPFQSPPTDGPEIIVPVEDPIEEEKRQVDFSYPGGPWTTDSELPSETTWYGGGPAFTLTSPPSGFTTDAPSLVFPEIERVNEDKRQLLPLTRLTTQTKRPWTTNSPLPVETSWYGGQPGFTLTFPALAAVTPAPKMARRQEGVGLITIGGPWTEDDGRTFTEYWGYPGETVTLQGPHGDETLRLVRPDPADATWGPDKLRRVVN